MQPTPYSDINRLIQVLLTNMQQVLGTKLVGLYLYGSLVTGDFDPKISDIDLLAALESDIDDVEFERLEKMHADFINQHKEWDNRIEIVYMSVEALKTFKEKDSKVAVISPGEDFHTKEVGNHWLMNWYIVQEQGVALFGSSPKTVIAPITKEEFIQSVKDHTRSWNEWVKDMKNRKAQAYAILTLCRAYYSYKNGAQVSKKQAATWTGEQFPQWSELIQNAITWREGGKDDSDDVNYPKTVEFVNFIRDQILKSK